MMTAEGVQPLAPPPWARMGAWVRPDDGDTLFGIAAIATYLGFGFDDTARMIAAGHLPTTKTGRAHTARRTDLARCFIEAEAAACRAGCVAPPPVDLAAAGALGLIRERPAIAAYLGITDSAVRWHVRRNGLPTFRIGAPTFARRASLDHWRAITAGETSGSRRTASFAARRRAREQSEGNG